ncbi:MAG: YjbQ family protein [Candidatus Bathyarchaeota archaeon]|nr:MAG: YjbQ family protein [Candidatus Bathyarchaeota archaeon]
MAVFTSELVFETGGYFDIVDLTARVEGAVRASDIREGIALVYAGHATGVIILNELERALLDDLRELMASLAPADGVYHHPVNSRSHLLSMLFTPSRTVPVHGGRLGLGTWQSLYWVEAERRPRRRRVEVTVVGE